MCGTLLAIALSGWTAADTGYHAADTVATNARFEKDHIKTGLSTITAYYRFTRPGAPLTIYIEGDGMAWRSSRELSDDPTPNHPLVLSLAAADPAENVAYLARPGQLTESGLPDCDPAYWSDKRFSREVVTAINAAIDYLKTKSRTKEINIIGYSGGAFIAVLVTAGRGDIVSLRTIAGNLDPDAVNHYHNVSPLEATQSLTTIAAAVAHVPQRHFIGSADTVVPPSVAQAFVEKTGVQPGARITVVKGATHTKGWQEHWAELLTSPLR